ncbi:MAG: hypothetical protein OES47_00535 [Acidobacteriota bacterium]|nr:hypothetical protein [Acidobacteriota bacterium]
MRRAGTLLIAVAAVAIVTAAMAPEAAAKRLSDQFIRIEVNDTDGDAGIHLFLDGEGWDTMQLRDPEGNVLFSILGEGSVGFQGITETFFESAEPSFDEQTLDELLELFPEGIYTYKGTTTEGKKLRGRARLTHRIPDAPVQVSPLEGDEVDPEDAVFTWEPVADPPGSSIVAYEIVVECEEPTVRKILAQVDGSVTSYTAAPEFFENADECKWEVLSIEESGNQTISEVEFDLE